MSVIEHIGEGVARRMDRRRFLRRTAAAAFGVVAAWTVEGGLVPGALAQACAAYSSDYYCNPPAGHFCSGQNGQKCSGSACSGSCKYDTSYYATGCWCTLTGPTGANGAQGYFTCCDCLCNGRHHACGCKQWHPAA